MSHYRAVTRVYLLYGAKIVKVGLLYYGRVWNIFVFTKEKRPALLLERSRF